MNSEQPSTNLFITRINLCFEGDIVTARQQVRKIAELMGFENQDQIRIATSVSEVARNAYQYAAGGFVEVEARVQPEEAGIVVRVVDSGPGISNLEDVLSGRYKSRTGLGQGILGTRRLMDEFAIESSPAGCTVSFFKKLSARARNLTPDAMESLRRQLQNQRPAAPLYELQRQNQELMRTLDELRSRQEELALLNAELDSTNRGVLALNAELDERATYLRNIDEMKTKFLSNMTHEFRTPLTSIIMLAEILIDGLDGPLLKDQEKQVALIKQVAEELSGFVDDLLDLAKIEAGHVTVRAASCEVQVIFDILKGMLKPITKDSMITLKFEYPANSIEFVSDEGKVSQILRNFISNAIKFTIEGGVTVSVQAEDEKVIFCVADTGISIDAENLDVIFHEFGQVETAMQAKVKGTGLGLSICRRLAGLLNGEVWAESINGQGSQFYLAIPKTFVCANQNTDLNPSG